MKWLRVTLAAVGILILATGFVLYTQRTQAGFVENLTQLPKYGAQLPNVKTGLVAYELRKGQLLLVRFDAPATTFYALREKFNLTGIGYHQGFPGTPSEIGNDFYEPRDGEVKTAWGPFFKDGRTMIRVYYVAISPQKPDLGTVFIHIN